MTRGTRATKDLSIVVVSFNTKEFLRRCLCSIRASVHGLDFETIVVDNSSQDSSLLMVRRLFPWVSLVANQTNRGYAAAANQGIEASQGRFVALVNSDVEILPNAMSKMLDFMDSHPLAGIVGCRLLNPDGALQPSIYSFPNTIKEILAITVKGLLVRNEARSRRLLGGYLSPLLRVSMSRFDDHSQIKEIDFPCGACLVARREAIEQVGTLDEKFFFTGEEADWCHRMKERGWRVYYYPEATVIHYGRGASKGIKGRVFIQRYKSLLYFYEKHYGKLGTWLLKLSVSAILVLKCLVVTLCLLGPFSNKPLLRSKRELWWAVVRLFYDQEFRELNMFDDFLRYSP